MNKTKENLRSFMNIFKNKETGLYKEEIKYSDSIPHKGDIRFVDVITKTMSAQIEMIKFFERSSVIYYTIDMIPVLESIAGDISLLHVSWLEDGIIQTYYIRIG